MPLTLDPEYLRAMEPMLSQLSNAPKFPIGDVSSRRTAINALMPTLQAQLDPVTDVSVTQTTIPASDGHHIPLYHFTKNSSSSSSSYSHPSPAIIYTHGGGFFSLSVDSYLPLLKTYVSMTGRPLFAMDYRLPPDHPFPTPLEDCYAALLHVSHNSQALNVDPARLAIMGDSAGGGLASGTAILARDRHLDPPLAKQFIVCAMLDDRNTVPGDHDDIAPFVTWDQDSNITGWRAYLGDPNHAASGVSGVSVPVPVAAAAPARLDDVSGLPATYLDVPGLDIVRDENIRYAARIAAAGVEVECHVWPGVPHGFELFAPKTGIARMAMMMRVRALSTF